MHAWHDCGYESEEANQLLLDNGISFEVKYCVDATFIIDDNSDIGIDNDDNNDDNIVDVNDDDNDADNDNDDDADDDADAVGGIGDDDGDDIIVVVIVVVIGVVVIGVEVVGVEVVGVEVVEVVGVVVVVVEPKKQILINLSTFLKYYSQLLINYLKLLIDY